MLLWTAPVNAIVEYSLIIIYITRQCMLCDLDTSSTAEFRAVLQ